MAGIDRRTVLRGVGGVALALPALEIMSGGSKRARAAGAPPKRYVVCYGGTSTGAYQGQDLVIPATTGVAYASTLGLAPLSDLTVKKEVSIVSGLKVPWGQAGQIPPGGRIVNFHDVSMAPQLTGLKATRRNPTLNGPSSDQIVADALAGDTVHRSLALRVQPVSYAGSGSGARGRMSWDKRGIPIEPIASPRLAFESVFAAMAAADGAGAAALALARRRSVLDLVRDNATRLLPRLGRADADRLQRHFEEVRDLEKRLGAPLGTRPPGCQLPADPGGDPPIGTDYGRPNAMNHTYQLSAGYSQEERRAEMMVDLLHMALVCDLTRVASLVISMTQSFINMAPLIGRQRDMHALGHGGGSVKDMASAVAWHVKHFGRLVGKLRDTPEADGTTLLDHSVLLLLFEGGHGFDPEGGGQNSPHSTENMVALIAGRAGGLKPGQHVVAKDKHPAQVVISGMNAVGVAGGLGEVSGTIPELFGL